MNSFQLGPWVVHANRHQLAKDGVDVRLEPRAMQLLSYLAERAGEVATKKEILDAVWEGTFVSDESLTYSIWEIRKTLGDDAKNPTFIQTIPKKGYRLIAPVRPLLEETSDVIQDGPKPRTPSSSWRFLTAVALAFVAGGAVAWLMSRGEENSSSRAIGASGRPTVALGHFENHTGLEELAWLSRGAPSMLLTNLAQTPGMDLVSLERLETLSQELRAESSDTTLRGARLIEIAEHAGAGAVVVGNVFRSGRRLRIDVQLQDVGTGRILLAHSESGEDVFAVVDRLTERIRTSLDVPSRGDPRPLAEVATSSLEAYRLYSEGLLAERNARWSDAKERYEAAVEIDPNFAMAYFRLSKQHYVATDEERLAYRQRVLELLDKLPERQRLYVDATYEEDATKAVALWHQLLDRYPDEADGYRSLSFVYLFKLRAPKQAFEVMRTAVTALPRSGSLRNEYAYQLMERGRYPEAVAQLEAYRQIHPKEPNPHDSLGHAFLLSGAPEQAIEHYTRALELDPSFLAAYEGRAAAFSVLGRFEEALADLEARDERAESEPELSAAGVEDQEAPSNVRKETALLRTFLLSRMGRYGEARRQIEETIAANPASPKLESSLRLVAAYSALERQDEDGAEAALRKATDALSTDEEDDEYLYGTLHLLSGVVAARRLHLKRAERHLDALERLHQNTEAGSVLFDWWAAALRGELALAHEEWDAAETIFREAQPESRRWFPVTDYPRAIVTGVFVLRDGRARAEVGRGDRRTAATRYREVLASGPSNPWTATLEPRFVLELARLLESTGDLSSARAEYSRFLRLWKAADSDLPELSRARSALERIESRS